MLEYLTHIALDLELEQPKTNPQTPDSLLDEEKIIQVGYVVFKVFPEFEVLQTRSLFINIGIPLSTFIKKLTGITDKQITVGGTIEGAYNKLVFDMQMYKCRRVVKQWGGGDMECLRREVSGLDWKFGRSGHNVKHMYQTYAEANGLKRSGGLSKSMGQCGLQWEGRGKHNAAIDALNTARFYDFFQRSMQC